MPLPTVNCHWKSSLPQPNQPGWTSPDTPPPYPTKLWLTYLPSWILRVGRTTPRKSTWPQGCDQYDAKVTSGAEDFVMLLANVQEVVPAIEIPLAMQGNEPTVERLAATSEPLVTVWLFASVAILPAGVMTSVCGVSAETENALP